MRRRELLAVVFKQAYSDAALSKGSWLTFRAGNIKALIVYYLKRSAPELYQRQRNAFLTNGWNSSDKTSARTTAAHKTDGLVKYLYDTHLGGADGRGFATERRPAFQKMKGRDLDMPNKIIGLRPTVKRESIRLNQTLDAISIVVKGMGCTGVYTVDTSSRGNTPLDKTRPRIGTGQFTFSLRENCGEAHAHDSTGETGCLLRRSPACDTGGGYNMHAATSWVSPTSAFIFSQIIHLIQAETLIPRRFELVSLTSWFLRMFYPVSNWTPQLCSTFGGQVG